MKIDASLIHFQYDRQYDQEEIVSERRSLNIRLPEDTAARNSGSVTVSDRARNLYHAYRSFSLLNDTHIKPMSPGQEGATKSLFAAMVNQVTGRQVTVTQIATTQMAGTDTGEPFSAPEPPSLRDVDTPVRTDRLSPLFELQVTRQRTYVERETATFQSSGVIVTDDGREISFDLNLSMNRSFYAMEQSATGFDVSDLIDPIVITKNGEPPVLGDTYFTFDMNGDGTKETLSTLQAGAGFLALDKSGDGVINDGTELFGPNTGNGFAELSAYDADGNRWIDENDPVFDQLTVWHRDADGEDRMISLKAAGVGAIYLGSAETPFQMRDDKNVLQGQLTQTGVLVRENGSVHQIYQMDLADQTRAETVPVETAAPDSPETETVAGRRSLLLGLQQSFDFEPYFSPAQEIVDAMKERFEKLKLQLTQIREDQEKRLAQKLASGWPHPSFWSH
ncbi:MAG: hypothetical protein CSA22_10730 [Deltaproteobacteria bacterium]|nr:MAG: hypothetical protein CSA22_10730 [Deltaproteobacteria bacterium]